VYRAQNIIKDDVVAVKLEPIIDGSSSVQREYHILKVGIPRALWFGRESTYHALVLDLLGPSLHDLFLMHNRKFPLHTVINLAEQTVFIINFGISKEYCDISTRLHVPFHHNRHLTGTAAFASINNHLGVEPGCRDDLKSLTYMLIYFLRGSLPWLTNDHEKLSSSTMLKRKANTTIEVLCREIPVEFATMLIYTHSLAFSEDPDYDHLRSLLHGICTTFTIPTTCSLDFNQSNDPVMYPPLSPDECLMAAAATPCLLQVMPPCNSSHV
jgi:hypothetical protein